MELNEEEKEKFAKDIPFYKNINCFCLGKSLYQAAEITKQIILAKGTSECGTGCLEN